MEASIHPSPLDRLRALSARVDFQGVSVWLLGFALVVYLGLEGGGYDPIVRNQLGIAVWWGVVLGLAVGALPVRRLGHRAWVAGGLLAALAAWTALSAAWSSSVDASFEDMGRVATFFGVFALALGIRGSKGARRMVGAVGSAIFVIATVALLSRLRPAWFPDAVQMSLLTEGSRSRLAYPLGYWNGVGVLTAMGLPLLLHYACSARHLLTRALAAAALPAMALTIYLTFSRGGILCATIAVVAYLALAGDRVPKAATVLFAGVAGAILIAAAHQREALDAGLAGPLAREQGDQMLAMTLLVCAGVAFLQAGLSVALRYGKRPAWTRPGRGVSLGLLGAGAAAVAIVVALLVGGGHVSHAWDEFTASEGTGSSPDRLQSFSSNGRLPLWEAAVEQYESAPLVGAGTGTFQSWWAQHGGDAGFVTDAHSLYLETLAELGIVGLALLLAFLGWVFYSGARLFASAQRQRRDQLAAALAACIAFCVGVAFDWFWELAILPIAFLLLASVLVSTGGRSLRAPLPLAARLAGVAVGVAAMVAIAIPLAGESAVQQSQAAVRAGQLELALAKARDANAVEPFSAEAALQEALVLEEQGRLAAAQAAAAAATEREPGDWRTWVVLSRLQAKRGLAAPAVASYRRARSLNPESGLFR